MEEGSGNLVASSGAIKNPASATRPRGEVMGAGGVVRRGRHRAFRDAPWPDGDCGGGFGCLVAGASDFLGWAGGRGRSGGRSHVAIGEDPL